MTERLNWLTVWFSPEGKILSFKQIVLHGAKGPKQVSGFHAMYGQGADKQKIGGATAIKKTLEEE